MEYTEEYKRYLDAHYGLVERTVEEENDFNLYKEMLAKAEGIGLNPEEQALFDEYKLFMDKFHGEAELTPEEQAAFDEYKKEMDNCWMFPEKEDL